MNRDQSLDDAAVDQFAAMLKATLAKARSKGRSGWRDPAWPAADINRQMHEHAAKGDPLDVAAYAMFLALRGERTTAQPEQPNGYFQTGVLTAPPVQPEQRGEVVAVVVSSRPDNYGANHRIKWTTGEILPVGTNLYTSPPAPAVPVAPAVPDGWREFIAECATFAGQMVNGNRLSGQAAKLLAAAPEQPR